MKTKTAARKTAKTAAKSEPRSSQRIKAASVRSKTIGRTKAVPKKRAQPARNRQVAPAGRAPIYYRLHALLQTVQVIARFEDSLAALLHEAGRGGALDADACEELHNLLLNMPSSSYHAELDALHETLHALREREAA